MRVLDFKKEEFEKFLNDELGKSNSSQKILVLGIAEGGIPVAEMVYEFFKKETQNEVNLAFVKVQRPSTKQKKANPKREKILKSLFSVLPKFVLNYLRILEHKKLKNRSEADLKREIHYASLIEFSNYDQVWIVDDAVDSGASMKAVVDDLSFKINKLRIKTLSVVVTQENPIFMPDLYLFQNVLIRFPWSLDGKK